MLGLLLLAGLLAFPVGASAAGWLAPEGMSIAASDVGFDTGGDALAVGIGAAGPGGPATIRATDRPAGGTWSAAVAVSGSGDYALQPPQVAVDPDGDAVVIWSALDLGTATQVVRVASRPAGGAWGAPATLSSGAAYPGAHYEVAIDDQGNATAVWVEFQATAYVVRAASRPHDGGWSGAVDLSDASDGNARSPRLAVGLQGNATAVWLGDAPGPGGSGTVKVVRAKSRPVGGAWSATAAELSVDGSADAPQVAADSQGKATVVWDVFESGAYRVQGRRAVGGSWSAVADLGGGRAARVAVDPLGNATAVWEAASLDGVRTSRSAAGGAWSAAAELPIGSGAGNPKMPWVGVDPQGNVTAIWGRSEGSQTTAQASRRAVGSGWSAPVDLVVGPLTAVPAAGVDPQGHTTLVWSDSYVLGPWSGSSSVFDPVGPELRALAVPARAIVGQQVTMGVDPFDAWSAVTTSWEFGDGRSGTGAAVGHAYDAPGERTVTISGVDAAGNTTRTSRTITIDAVPADPGPGPGPAPSPGPAPGPTPTAPVLSGLQQSASRWRTQRSTRRSRLPVGTSFRFRLDRAAQVRLAFSQVGSGRRIGGRCVKATKTNRRKSRCDHEQARGTLTVVGKAGANARAFRGKLGGRTLKPGRYRLTATATADGKPSRTASVRFTIDR